MAATVNRALLLATLLVFVGAATDLDSNAMVQVKLGTGDNNAEAAAGSVGYTPVMEFWPAGSGCTGAGSYIQTAPQAPSNGVCYPYSESPDLETSAEAAAMGLNHGLPTAYYKYTWASATQVTVAGFCNSDCSSCFMTTTLTVGTCHDNPTGQANAPMIRVPSAAYASATSAKGDPHVKNIAGHAFDILRAGTYTILDVPRGETGSESLLSVESRVEHQLNHMTGEVQCHSLWIRNLVLSGKLLDEVYEFGLMANQKFFLRMGNTTTESPEEFAKLAQKFQVELSPIPNKYYQRKKAKIYVLASMKVEAGPTMMTIDLVKMPVLTASHLDFDIQNLKGLIADERVGSVDMIGGLIGTDDHVHASTSDCKEPQLLFETDDQHGGSILAASLE